MQLQGVLKKCVMTSLFTYTKKEVLKIYTILIPILYMNIIVLLLKMLHKDSPVL